MRYQDFEKTMSPYRMNRYLTACGGNTKQAMTLYRLNLRLSQEMFTVISCFEVALRNAIDNYYLATLGTDWLKNAASPNGIFDSRACQFTKIAINEVVQSLGAHYSHGKVVAGLGFGVWRYLFFRPAWCFHQAGSVQHGQSSPKISFSKNNCINTISI